MFCFVFLQRGQQVAAEDMHIPPHPVVSSDAVQTPPRYFGPVRHFCDGGGGVGDTEGEKVMKVFRPHPF